MCLSSSRREEWGGGERGWDEGGEGLEEGGESELEMEGDIQHAARIYFIYNIQIYSRRLERYSVLLHIKYMSGYIMNQLQFYSQGALTVSNRQKGERYSVKGCTELLRRLVSALCRKSDFCNPRNETAPPRSQFLHPCVCERFIYSQNQAAYLTAEKQADQSWEYTKSFTDECGN